MADHGEVFTPAWMVQAMLDMVGNEASRIDSRFLEPACGSGNFLVAVLERKLTAVNLRYGQSDFERRHQALLALMSIYGIELLPDNVGECRENLLEHFIRYLDCSGEDVFGQAATQVLLTNIVQGDALTMTTTGDSPHPLVLSEWSYLGRGKYQRREFSYAKLTQMSEYGEGTLFADVPRDLIFTPERNVDNLSVQDIANG